MNIDPELLARHRDGDRKATEELICILVPLVKKNLARQRSKLQYHIEREELESVLYEDLCVAVDRLRQNEKRAEEVERYVKNDLKHSWKRCMRENSEDVLPPKGEKGAERIKRKKSITSGEPEDDEQITDLLEIAVSSAVDDELINREEFEPLLAVAERQLERATIELALSKFDPLESDVFEGINEVTITALLKRLRERAKKPVEAEKSKKTKAGRKRLKRHRARVESDK